MRRLPPHMRRDVALFTLVSSVERAQIEQRAAEEGRSLADIVRRAVLRDLAENGAKQARVKRSA